MKFTSYTVAAVLAIALAQVGAMPSPSAPTGAVSGPHKGEHDGKGRGHNADMDMDGVDLDPYLNHKDPVIQHLARREKQAPESHWWQSQSEKGSNIDPVLIGNPNVRQIGNIKEQAPYVYGVFKRGDGEYVGAGMGMDMGNAGGREHPQGPVEAQDHRPADANGANGGAWESRQAGHGRQ